MIKSLFRPYNCPCIYRPKLKKQDFVCIDKGICTVINEKIYIQSVFTLKFTRTKPEKFQFELYRHLNYMAKIILQIKIIPQSVNALFLLFMQPVFRKRKL